MKIDLNLKSKGVEKQRKKTSFFLVSFSLLLVSASVVLMMVISGINFSKNSSLKSLDKEISQKKDSLSKYSDLEKNINYTSVGLLDIKQIIETRIKWSNFFREMEKLMPRESAITDISLSQNEVTFKTRVTKIEKAVEFVDSLMAYKITPSQNLNLGTGSVPSSGEQVSATSSNYLFSGIDISNFSKTIEGSNTYYNFEFKANISEEVWKN